MTAGRRVLVVATVALVLAGAVVGGILYLRDDDPPTDYDARIEDDFMATCTADAEAQSFRRPADFCRCAFDAVREQVPFDRFLAIDAALAEDPTAVPAEIDRIRSTCYLEVEAAGATPPTTSAAG